MNRVHLYLSENSYWILQELKVKLICKTYNQLFNKLRELIIKQTSIPEDFIITLRKNSIEDYLLVPAAIKRAFPSVSMSVEEISAFFESRKNKRDKKKVLDDLFNKLGLGGYNSEKARIIASKMEISEIDKELKIIFKRILSIII